MATRWGLRWSLDLDDNLQRRLYFAHSYEAATLFQVARLEAIKFNVPVKVVFEVTEKRFHAFVDQDRDGIEDATERRLPLTVILPLKVDLRGPG